MTAASAMWATYAGASAARSISLTSLLPRLMFAWQAPETALMAGKVTRFLAWNEALRVQQTLAATRHAEQAASYTTALAGMVHPPEITQNHVTNATLNATNFLGVNTGAIAANEAEYAWMWAHNAGVMASYLANTAATMSFEPFMPPEPIVNPGSLGVRPPMAEALYTIGESVATKVMLAATTVEMQAKYLAQQVSSSVSLAAAAGTSAAKQPVKAESRAGEAQLHSNDRPAKQQDAMGQQLGQQLIQQLATQAPSQGAQAAQQVVQMPQQAVQQLTQVPQQIAQQAVQPLSQLMSSVYPEHQTANVGYFGTSPSSPTLDHLTGATGAGAYGAGAFRGFSMAGFASPTSWGGGSGATPAAAPLAPPRAPMEPIRPMSSSVGNSSPLARQTGRQRERAVIPTLDATPVPIYQEETPELETVPVGATAGGEGE